MNASIFLVIALLPLIIKNIPNALAAYINCNQVPDTCNGTDNGDTMTASGINGVEFTYNINGNGGSDKISVNNVDVTFNTIIHGGSGNDIITGKSERNIFGIGDEGNDVITLSGAHVAAAGLDGADKLIGHSVVSLVLLLQNNPANEPDGKKDFLDCKGSEQSIAYISSEDGDIAVNCKIVKTGLQPIS
jgi:Ca2+-binding RTX toxin-like protein